MLTHHRREEEEGGGGGAACQTHNAAALGASAFGMNDIYVRFKAYKNQLRQAGLLGTRPLFMVGLDVKNAFDSIPHDKLLAITADLFTEVCKRARILRGQPAALTRVYAGCCVTRRKPNRRCTSSSGTRPSSSANRMRDGRFDRWPCHQVRRIPDANAQFARTDFSVRHRASAADFVQFQQLAKELAASFRRTYFVDQVGPTGKPGQQKGWRLG